MKLSLITKSFCFLGLIGNYLSVCESLFEIYNWVDAFLLKTKIFVHLSQTFVLYCTLVRRKQARGSSLFLAAKRTNSPLSGRLRATKSREVDLSRLQGFLSHFAPKMGSGVTRIWGFRFHLRVLDFSGGMSRFHSNQIYWTCMWISIIEGANLFTVCESCF